VAAWILLLLTLVCAYVSYRAQKWGEGIQSAPPELLGELWKGRLEHLSLMERKALRDRLATSPIGFGRLVGFLWLLTFMLAVTTVQAFLR
jgi:hypothetical protein